MMRFFNPEHKSIVRVQIMGITNRKTTQTRSLTLEDTNMEEVWAALISFLEQRTGTEYQQDPRVLRRKARKGKEAQ